MREDVIAAALDNATTKELEREKVLAENARFREGYSVLLECWHHIPQDLRPSFSDRLGTHFT